MAIPAEEVRQLKDHHTAILEIVTLIRQSLYFIMVNKQHASNITASY